MVEAGLMNGVSGLLKSSATIIARHLRRSQEFAKTRLEAFSEKRSKAEKEKTSKQSQSINGQKPTILIRHLRILFGVVADVVICLARQLPQKSSGRARERLHRPGHVLLSQQKRLNKRLRRVLQILNWNLITINDRCKVKNPIVFIKRPHIITVYYTVLLSAITVGWLDRSPQATKIYKLLLIRRLTPLISPPLISSLWKLGIEFSAVVSSLILLMKELFLVCGLKSEDGASITGLNNLLSPPHNKISPKSKQQNIHDAHKVNSMIPFTLYKQKHGTRQMPQCTRTESSESQSILGNISMATYYGQGMGNIWCT